MPPAVQGVDGDHADARPVGTVFTHKAVRMRPVREVFGHEGDGHRDLRQVLDAALDLKGGEECGGVRFSEMHQATFCLEGPESSSHRRVKKVVKVGFMVHKCINNSVLREDLCLFPYTEYARC